VQQGARGQMQRQLLQHCRSDHRFPPGVSQMRETEAHTDFVSVA